MFFSVFLQYLGNRIRYKKNKTILNWKRHPNNILLFMKKNCLQHFMSWFVIFQKKIWLKKSQKLDILGKNKGQIRIQHKKLLRKWRISSHKHIGHFWWPALWAYYSFLLFLFLKYNINSNLVIFSDFSSAWLGFSIWKM